MAFKSISVWTCILSSFVCVNMEHVFPESDAYVRHVDVNEGDDVSIPCNTTESPDIELYWTKNATSFRREGLYLNFTSINRTDHGDYICNSFNNKTQVLAEIQTVSVNVSYKAEVKSIRIDPQVLTENETYTVSCDIEGNPAPSWVISNNYTKDLLGLGQGSGKAVTGTITAKCDDTGTIVCRAHNILNKPQGYMSENITVFCSPRPRPGTNTHTISSFVGGPAYLIMNLMGYPPPNCTWSRDDGQPIKDATRIVYPYFAVLNLTNIVVSDFGNYSLTMENSYGSYTDHFQLIAIGAPEMPYNLYYSNVTHDSVILYWTSGFDMGSQQIFHIMELLGGNSYTTISNVVDNSTTHGVGQNWTDLQTNLASDSDITLTVQSINGFGFRSLYVTPGVTFHTLPDPHNGGSFLSHHKTAIIIGVTVGSVVIIGFTTGMMAFITYRRKRKSYSSIK